jgi:hypothetical protein
MEGEGVQVGIERHRAASSGIEAAASGIEAEASGIEARSKRDG